MFVCRQVDWRKIPITLIMPCRDFEGDGLITTPATCQDAAAMDFVLWRQNVLDAARRAADRSYQERVWFGHDPQRRDSPDDLICTFTDDLVFDKFLLDPQLSQREREAAARLYKAVEEYADSTPQVLKPADVIDDPQFERVRIAARELLKIAESVV